jgi:hypothetical protein
VFDGPGGGKRRSATISGLIDPANKRAQNLDRRLKGVSMVNHLARAKEMRRRAQNCQVSAENSKSEKFADCYRLLAQNYDILATVEEEFVAREMLRQNKAHDQFQTMLQSLNVADT